MATTPLLSLARSGDDDLTRAALLALAEHRDRRALPLLLEDALLARGAARGAALLALDAWAGGEPPPDEALAIEGTRLDVEALIAARERRTPDAASVAARPTVWHDDARLVATVLSAAMNDVAADRRLAALEALGARDDGPGAGALAPGGVMPLAPATAEALTAVGAATIDAVAQRLDDQVGAVRAAALRVLARSNDARATAARVARAAAGGPEERAAAAEVARRWSETSPSAASALAAALSKDLAAAAPSIHPRPGRAGQVGPAGQVGDDGWQARLGLVGALAATGAPGQAGLRSALGDPNPLVRVAAATALDASAEATARPRH
jgi:hypothetical protein